MREKTIFTLSFPVTLTFDLLNPKFALPVTLVRSCLHQIWSYGFPITSKLYVGLRDRRTNGVQRSYSIIMILLLQKVNNYGERQQLSRFYDFTHPWNLCFRPISIGFMVNINYHHHLTIIWNCECCCWLALSDTWQRSTLLAVKATQRHSERWSTTDPLNHSVLSVF